MKTIGIIGGCSDVATVEYYKAINAGIRKHLGGKNIGEMVIANLNWAEVNRIIAEDIWEEGSLYLRDKAERLEAARCDFIICVANTMHRMADGFMKGINIPLLHIVDPTAIAIKKSGLSKVLLLGTKPTMSAMFLRDRYQNVFGIETIVPSEEHQNEINAIIFHELTQYIFKPESRQRYLEIVDVYSKQGAQGVILGCTEISLLLSQADIPKTPLFDVLRLHVEASVLVALADQPAAECIKNLSTIVA